MTPAAPAERMAVAFARVLRGAGVQVPIGSVLAFVEAVGALDLAERDHVYWAGRTTLVRRPEDRQVYDRAFAVFWEQRRTDDSPTDEEEPLRITLTVDDESDGDDQQDHQSGDQDHDPPIGCVDGFARGLPAYPLQLRRGGRQRGGLQLQPSGDDRPRARTRGSQGDELGEHSDIRCERDVIVAGRDRQRELDLEERHRG